VVVSTDDLDIQQCAIDAGAEVVRRPAVISTGSSPSESALLHALDVMARVDSEDLVIGEGRAADPIDPDGIAFIQATSPFIDPTTLRKALDSVASGQADVVFAAKESHAFQWRTDGNGVVPVGHDATSRPMRQDRPPHYQETGAFYVMNAEGFRAARHRFFGRIAVCEVPEETAFEIDTPSDLRMCQAVASWVDPMIGMGTQPIDVDAVVTDFDGVHTDDRVLIDLDGGEHVTVNRRDGLGAARLRDAGIPFLIISSEHNGIVRSRAAKLRADVLHGVGDKADALTSWLRQRDIAPNRVAYLGNDVNDLPAMQIVGWPCAVADAHPQVKLAARLVLTQAGGDGAFRELCDRILAAREAGRTVAPVLWSAPGGTLSIRSMAWP